VIIVLCAIIGGLSAAVFIALDHGHRTWAAEHTARLNEQEARLAAQHFIESLENELFKVRAISGARPGERTASAVRRLLISARAPRTPKDKVWS
jgi:hypothetical protein